MYEGRGPSPHRSFHSLRVTRGGVAPARSSLRFTSFFARGYARGFAAPVSTKERRGEA